MLSVVKLLLKGEVGGQALNSHVNYIADHRKSWKNHGIVLLNLCGNLVLMYISFQTNIAINRFIVTALTSEGSVFQLLWVIDAVAQSSIFQSCTLIG